MIGIGLTVAVVYERSCEDQLKTIRSRASSEQSEQQLSAARQLKHKNLVEIYEIFVSETALYFICPYLDISLQAINACPRFPDSIQVGAIAFEVYIPCIVKFMLI